VLTDGRPDGRPDTLTDSRVYSLFEYTKRRQLLLENILKFDAQRFFLEMKLYNG
jgi:hypothetical protein